MKYETLLSDLLLFIAYEEADRQNKKARFELIESLDRKNDDPKARLEAALDAGAARKDTEQLFQRLPRSRQQEAKRISQAAKLNAAGLLESRAPRYSGSTNYTVQWGEITTAETLQRKGAAYSSRCGHFRTDAEHKITLDPAGAVQLARRPDIQDASFREGLWLLSYYPDGRAVWFKGPKHPSKKIGYTGGWVAYRNGTCYHSTVSKEDAEVGLEKKLRGISLEKAKKKTQAKQERRAALIVRMCHGVKATLQDALELGYCRPGIAEFQRRHGIEDSATLPELASTGNPMALRLALHCARKVKRDERSDKSKESQRA